MHRIIIHGELIEFRARMLQGKITAGKIIIRLNLPGAVKEAMSIIHTVPLVHAFTQLYAQTQEMKKAVEQAKRSVEENGYICIVGEKGTEKKSFAGAIHGSMIIRNKRYMEISFNFPSAVSFERLAGVLALPYVLKGDNEREHYESLIKLSKSDAYNEIAMEAEQEDLKVISESIWWYGDKHITTNDRPIRTPEDLKGIKIRVPDAKVHTEPFKLMGANVTPMAFTDVYMALKTGTVEAQEYDYFRKIL